MLIFIDKGLYKHLDEVTKEELLTSGLTTGARLHTSVLGMAHCTTPPARGTELVIDKVYYDVVEVPERVVLVPTGSEGNWKEQVIQVFCRKQT